MEPSIRHLHSGGVEVITEHPESDSLCVVKITHRNNRLVAEVVMRGNFDVYDRPVERTWVSFKAKLVSAAVRAEHKREWFRRNRWRFR